MSYIAKKGSAAIDAALADKQTLDLSKLLVSFKSGKQYKVRIASTEDFVQYFAHSVYKKFYTTPCTKPLGKSDYYDLACDILYKDANEAEKEGNTSKAEELRKEAYQLKAKERYLVGLIDLETGQPIIIDLTKNQAKQVVAQIKKYATKIQKHAFILEKEGSGTDTTVSLSVVIDTDDLAEIERKNFEQTAGVAFDDSLFEKVLVVSDEERQLEDLRAFGFDVSRLNTNKQSTAASAHDFPHTEVDADEELGF